LIKDSRGSLRVLTQTLMRIARNGDVERFRAFVASDSFMRAFAGLDPGRRQSAMRCYGKAEALCETKARHPLVPPRRIDAERALKVSWSDPAMRTKLVDAYAVAAGDDEKAARILRVSLGAARLARKRHLNSATTRRAQNAS
jgi:hypothetical protein